MHFIIQILKGISPLHARHQIKEQEQQEQKHYRF